MGWRSFSVNGTYASFVGAPYKMVNLTELITQPPRHFIKHASLLSLRIDDSLSINRLILLSSGLSG